MCGKSTGHIHAVNMTHEKTLLEKRIGYLGVSLCMHPEHELMLLLVNTLQLDLKSDNQLEVSGTWAIIVYQFQKWVFSSMFYFYYLGCNGSYCIK